VFKTYCFDLDGTLCSNESLDYNEAKPFVDRIAMVNKLYDDGHTILIETARGSVSGVNWRDITEAQLNNWGVKHHTLRVGVKLAADIYIDDKAIKDIDFFYNNIK
jgi:phosphoglycolate phosphatase-like HAD superfamily hydrolase